MDDLTPVTAGDLSGTPLPQPMRLGKDGSIIPVAANMRHVGRRHPRTSQAMQERALPRSGKLKTEVWTALLQSEDGLTNPEVMATLGIEHQSSSAAIRNLVKTGHAVDSGRSRLNAKGNACIVWQAVLRTDV